MGSFGDMEPLGEQQGRSVYGAVVSMEHKVSMGDTWGHRALGDIRGMVSMGTWSPWGHWGHSVHGDVETLGTSGMWCLWGTVGTQSPWGHRGHGVHGGCGVHGAQGVHGDTWGHGAPEDIRDVVSMGLWCPWGTGCPWGTRCPWGHWGRGTLSHCFSVSESL